MERLLLPPGAFVPLVAAAVLLGCGEAGPVSMPAARPAGERPNVLLITLDTTRVDRLGAYGYPRPTSLQLDRLARDSLLFTRAVSTSSWTLPAHASLFTGRIPTSHGAHYDPEGELLLADALETGDVRSAYRASTIAEAESTLAERLARAGYATAGVAGGPWLKRVFGLAAGFEDYDESRVTTWQGAVAPDVTDAALRLLAGIGDSPFFLFVNYFDPHNPYEPTLSDWLVLFGNPLDLLGGWQRTIVRIAYDGEIRRMDRGLGRLLDALREGGLYDDALIVVTADHGELFGEGGRFGHGMHLSEAELHVPLLVKLPGNAHAGERRELRVSTAGVFALILEQAGLPVPAHALPSVTAPVQGPLVAETYPLPGVSVDGQWRALYVGNLKFVWNSEGRHELRDLSDGWDPEQNLIDQSPELGRRMQADLEAILAQSPPPAREPGGERAVDEETRKALEGLGYLR